MCQALEYGGKNFDGLNTNSLYAFNSPFEEAILVWTRPTAGPIMLGHYRHRHFPVDSALPLKPVTCKQKEKQLKKVLPKICCSHFFVHQAHTNYLLLFRNRTRLGCSGRTQSRVRSFTKLYIR